MHTKYVVREHVHESCNELDKVLRLRTTCFWPNIYCKFALIINNIHLSTKHMFCILYFNMMSSLLSTVKKPAVGNGRLFDGKDHINAG